MNDSKSAAAPPEFHLNLPEDTLQDLRNSGLADQTILASRIRVPLKGELPKSPSSNGFAEISEGESGGQGTRVGMAGVALTSARFTGKKASVRGMGGGEDTGARRANEESEAGSHQVQSGYVIPYFDLNGRMLEGFARTRLLPAMLNSSGKLIRYLQTRGTKNHVYIPPPPIIPSDVWRDPTVPLLITEGEKKALSASQYFAETGVPCIAFGGVDSWHDRTIIVTPESVEERKVGLVIKVKPGTEISQYSEQVVDELKSIEWQNRKVYICYDSDATVNLSVQRAAFELGLYLEEHGAIPVQIVLLPSSGQKVGLDDFIVAEGVAGLVNLLEDPSWRFPTMPPGPMKLWVQKQLDTSKNSRSVMRKVTRAVLASLDSRGNRYKDSGAGYYFFNLEDKILHCFGLDNTTVHSLRLSTLGSLLMNNYGIGTADTQALQRLADQFTAVEPIRLVKPRHVVTTEGDILYYQISDSRIAKVWADGVEFVDNGTDGILFVAGEVKALDEEKLEEVCHRTTSDVRGLWLESLKETTIDPIHSLSLEETYTLLACLFHLNPWFRRWRGLMLPLEIVEAEAGAGKQLCLDEPILTPTGWKLNRNIQVGDSIMNVEGTVSKVTGVYPQEVDKSYRIKFNDGTSVVSGADHLWTVTTWYHSFKGVPYKSWTKTTAELYEHHLSIKDKTTGYRNSRRHHIPIVQPMQFEEKDLPIDPYLLGALLGDGGFTSTQISFASADPDIIERVENALEAVGDNLVAQLTHVSPSGGQYAYRVNKPNTKEALKELDLLGKYSYEKAVPEVYKFGSIQQRLDLLRGLMDTDGTVGSLRKHRKTGETLLSGTQVQFDSTSLQLVRDVQELVQSLGGITYPIRTRKPWYTASDGSKKQGRDAYEININMPNQFNPFYLQRKARIWMPRTHLTPDRIVVDVEEVTGEPMQCITTDAPRGLFIIHDYIVTHNSSTFNLRRGVLTGNPSLDNPPTDIKDWYATIGAAPGIWVCDNLGNIRRDLKDRISDELARLITDPDPSVDMRELYTTSTVSRLPVDCTFAVTTISSPFHKADVLQRAILYHMHEIPAGSRDGSWYERKLRSRDEWVAEHLLVAQRFFRIVKEEWVDRYTSGHRLANFEQSLLCMGKAIGATEYEMLTIIGKLPAVTQEIVAANDPMMEALRQFAEEWTITHPRTREMPLQEVITWAQGDLDARFNKLYSMANVIVLHKYIVSYKSQVANSTGLTVTEKGGKVFLRITADMPLADQGDAKRK